MTEIIYDINRPWLTLDDWQKEYCFNSDPNKNYLLLCGRQVGKTTAMSIRAVELCINHYKKGEFVLINSITEKQGFHMLAKAKAYADELYYEKVDRSKENKPTKHRLMFKDGTGILCYAAGDTGEGLRGYTIKKLMPDEGSRMSEEYFIATLPMLSVIKGSMDIASTPCGKKHKDGSEKFFYKCSKDPDFEVIFVSAEDCPRHTPEFLKKAKETFSKLAYAQEFLAVFTDELKRIFDDDWIKKVCTLIKDTDYKINRNSKYFLGVDVAGLGKDDCAYTPFEKTEDFQVNQIDVIVEKRNYTTDTSDKVILLDHKYPFEKESIGIDDGGPGYGVWCNLMDDERTKRKTVALNNSSRSTDHEGIKSKKLLKEEMYFGLHVSGEKGKVKLLNDDEVKDSLSTIQHDEGKIFGSNSHITEAIIRAVRLATKDKDLNIFARRF